MREDSEQQGLLGDEQSPKRGSIVDTLKGIIAAFTTVIMHAIGATCVQLLQRRIPDLELNMFRSVAPFLMYSLYFLIKCNWPIIKRDKIGITSLYIVTSFTSILCYFVAVSLLPAALVSCVSTVSCLVSGLMLFSCVGEERITLKRILFAAICIFGVIMVIQPWQGSKLAEAEVMMSTHVINSTNNSCNDSLSGSHVTEATNHMTITGSQSEIDGTSRLFHEPVSKENSTSGPFKGINSLTDSEQSSTPGMILGYCLAVLNGVTAVFHPLIIKRSNQFITDHFHQVLFWCFASFTLVSFTLSLVVETPVLPSNWYDAAMVTIHALVCAAVWPFYIAAPKLISGNTYTLILTTDVIFMLIAQYTVLSSILPGHRNWMEVVGVVLVLIGCSMSSIMEIIGFRGKDFDTTDETIQMSKSAAESDVNNMK